MNTLAPTQSSKPQRLAPLKYAKLHRHADGEIHALSSDGRTIYVVTLGATPSCSCPAGTNGRRCYHLATAAMRYGGAAFFPPRRPARPLANTCIGDLYNGCTHVRCSTAVSA